MEAGLHTDLPKFLNRRGSKIKILPSIHKFEGRSLKNEPTASLRSLKSTEEDGPQLLFQITIGKATVL